MKTIIQAMLEEIYLRATKMAIEMNQTVGENNDRCVTLEQLEFILKSYQG